MQRAFRLRVVGRLLRVLEHAAGVARGATATLCPERCDRVEREASEHGLARAERTS